MIETFNEEVKPVVIDLHSICLEINFENFKKPEHVHFELAISGERNLYTEGMVVLP